MTVILDRAVRRKIKYSWRSPVMTVRYGRDAKRRVYDGLHIGTVSEYFYHTTRLVRIRLMPKQSIQSRKMWKCIESITMNRYNLNMSTISIMLQVYM